MVGTVLGETGRCCSSPTSDANHPRRLVVDWQRRRAATELGRGQPIIAFTLDAKSGNRERVRTAPVHERVVLGLSVPALRGG